MIDVQHRAEFDAIVTFSNGGGLSAEGFRIDVPGPDSGEDEVAALFIASMGLLMTADVVVSRLRIIPEPHKGTRGGPSDATKTPRSGQRQVRWVDLSHVIEAGMTTYPGLPGPDISPHLTRLESRVKYAAGTEFAIDRISMVGKHRHLPRQPLSPIRRRLRLG